MANVKISDLPDGGDLVSTDEIAVNRSGVTNKASLPQNLATTDSPTFAALTVDNINVNGNTIISTDTNGDITLTPDGTGTVNISSDLDLGASQNLSFNSTNILADSAGTMTLSNIDALDATTTTTITNAVHQPGAGKLFYVEGTVSAFAWGPPSGETTIDGFTTNNSRVLALSSFDGGDVDAGIWVTGTGTWTRATDYDTGAKIYGSMVVVVRGDNRKGRVLRCINETPPTVGTDKIEYDIDNSYRPDLKYAFKFTAMAIYEGTQLTDSNLPSPRSYPLYIGVEGGGTPSHSHPDGIRLENTSELGTYLDIVSYGAGAFGLKITDTESTFSGDKLHFDLDAQHSSDTIKVAFFKYSGVGKHSIGIYDGSSASGGTRVHSIGVNGTAADGDIYFYTDALFIDAGSNNDIGIHNSTPAYELDVTGDIQCSGDFRIATNSVLNATTLGSGVVNSSLTSVGTLGSLTVTNNINSASGVYQVGGTEVLSGTTLGSGVTASSLTSVGTLTALQVDNLNFNGNAFTSTSGAIDITPLSGQDLNITLGGAGDFVVNTDDIYVDTSAGQIGLGTTAVSSAKVSIDQSSATGATPVLRLDQGDADEPLVDFVGTAAGDTTSTISTLTTSGATTHHLQIDINGTKAWIAASTNNPS